MPTFRSGSASATSDTSKTATPLFSLDAAHPLTSELGPSVAPVREAPLGASSRLFASAVALFAEKGFHGTSTRDICRAAGTGETAIYDHFSSKEEILFLVMQLSHEEALRRLALADAKDPDDPPARLSRLASAFACFHAAWPIATRVANYELAALTHEHFLHIRALREQVEGYFDRVLEDGLKHGDFLIANKRPLLFAIISMSIGVSRWFRHDGPLTPEELGEQYGRFAVRMVGA